MNTFTTRASPNEMILRHINEGSNRVEESMNYLNE